MSWTFEKEVAALIPFAHTSQIANAPGNILNDSLNWTPITGKYTANGDEQYITIGSFIPDNMFTIVNRGGTYPFTSYAIEDVWVIPDSMISGVNKFSHDSGINITPNPSNGNFIVEFKSEKSCKAKIELVNLLGEKVSTENILLKAGRNNVTLNIRYLPDGIYFLKIISEKKFMTQKIIIQ